MKTLIIYTTKYGTVEKAANILRSKMNGEVTLVNLNQDMVPDLDDFDTVILGGSIYIGRIQKALTNYMKANLSSLLQKRIGLFICAGEKEPVLSRELEAAFPPELLKHATSQGKFGFEFNFDKLKIIDKILISKVKGVKKSISELDAEAIEKFAKAIWVC